MPYSSLAIANEFIDRARQDGQALDHLKLQKLVYLAHGWSLGIFGQPLIEEGVEAWRYGPVIRRLYEALRDYFRGLAQETRKARDQVAAADGKAQD